MRNIFGGNGTHRISIMIGNKKDIKGYIILTIKVELKKS